MIDLKQIKSVADWTKGRKKIASALTSVLGALPKERSESQLKIVNETEFDGYVRYRINFFAHDWERASGWLFIPDTREETPAILCCHSEVPQGKDECAGLSGDPLLAFAKHYAELGYVTLAPDCITAGERVYSGLEPLDTKSFYKDNRKMSALGRMLIDHIYALDALEESKHVDVSRIGVVGHGLGAVNALFLGAFDDRIQVCVASGGFTRFEKDADTGRWARDEGLVLLPKLRPAIESGEYPFDWEHVLAMAAPSAMLLATALNDDVLSGTSSCGEALKLAQNVYKVLGVSGAVENFSHKGGCSMNMEALVAADEWFDRWL